MDTAYTQGVWQVKPGRTDEFVAAWIEFADWTSANAEGSGSRTLVRDLAGDHRFVSGWTYGLTEVTGPASIGESTRVADPGCFPQNSEKQLRPGNFGLLISRAGTKSTGCCWPRFQIIPSVVESHFIRPQTVTSTQLAPSFCEAGAGQPFVITKILQACGAVPVGLGKSVISPFRC